MSGRYRDISQNPDDLMHGNLYGYKHHGCRCSRCKEACRIYSIARRAKERSKRAFVKTPEWELWNCTPTRSELMELRR